MLHRWPIALLLGALSAPAGCSSSHTPPRGSPLPARAVRAEPGRMVSRVVGEEVVGTVRARETVELAPTVMGQIASLRCELGARVKPGDVVARLSVEELTARLDQAHATLAQADIDLDRATRLHESKVIPAAEHDLAVSRHRIARAAVAEATTMAGYAAIRAPIAGVVTARLANVGDLAMPGRPVCVVEDPGSLRFEATVPESLSWAFAQASVVQVQLDTMDAPVSARVAEVSPNADPASRTVLVKLDLPRDPRIRAGTFGRAAVSAREVPALTVPARAVVRHGQLEAVYVVVDGLARMRLVRTGRSTGGLVELRSGAREGDLVVVDVADTLIDGQPVTVLR